MIFRKFGIVIVLAGLALGGLVGYYLGGRPRTFDVAFEPAAIQIEDRIGEFDNSSSKFALRNNTRKEITVKSLSTNCGCAVVRDEKDKIPSVPFVLAPSDVLPFTVSIRPRFYYGPITISVVAECENEGGRKAQPHLDISLSVMAGLRAFPPTIVFHGNSASGTRFTQAVNIYDAYPKAGIELDRIETSSGRVHAEILPSEGEKIDLPGKGSSGSDELKPRLKVQVTLDASQDNQTEKIHEFIRLVPKNADFPSVAIPISFTPKAPAIRITPQKLVVHVFSNNAEFRRTFECENTGAADLNLSVAEAPSYLKVEVKSVSNKRSLIIVSGQMPPNQRQSNGKIVLGNGSGKGDSISVPVELIRRDNL